MQYVSLQLWPFKEKSFSYIKQLSYFYVSEYTFVINLRQVINYKTFVTNSKMLYNLF